MRSRQYEDFSYSQGAMAESDERILPRAPFASAELGESDSGLLSVVSRSVHPGDETQTENNNLRSRDVGSVVQPGHITIEERLRNAVEGLVTLNDPQMAQGQHTDCVGEKMPKFPSQVKGKSRSTAGGKATRTRDSNWNDEQKSQLLMGKLRWFSDRLQQALAGDQSADHHFKSWSHQVAGQLSKTHEQCQGQWDTLLKSRNAIRDHEWKIEEGASGTQYVSFWDMSECQKDIANQERRERQKDTANQKRRGDKVELLPRVFPRERYELMEFILEIVEGVKKIPSWKKSFQKSSGIAETSIPPDSGITESPVVGQVSDGNTSQEGTINDNLATTQGNCEGAEDRKLKNDHDLVSILKDALLPHVSELQSWRVDKQKHRAKLIELEERKLALEEKKVEHLKRIYSVSNASSGQVEPSNMRFNCLADGQHVQAYDQMTPSGMCLLHLQNGANANTSADSDGQATGVPDTDPNLELLFANLPDGSFPDQPTNNDAVQPTELEDFLPAAILHSSAIFPDDELDVWGIFGI